ncbi:MAG: thiamine-phosphate kinase [Gammaproteobacteria bacterium]|nr:MAG: thiamine-phosphate kinase [Gammaproteobacteria bacterium]
MLEQELIQKYFTKHQAACGTVDVSVGDDAAIVNPPEDSKLVITTDTLNVGVHFHADCNPQFIGHKSLAVSLSDIAAMGAKPLWATLNLSLPDIDHQWLQDFSDGIYQLADAHKLRIVGGDIVKGPLSITVQVIGSLPEQRKLLRCACEIGDLIYVTGYLGDAALGLKLINNNFKSELNSNDRDYFLMCLHKPMPRFDISAHIVKYAHSAIDISDGFLIDLQRILSMSNKGAIIDLEKIPISRAMLRMVNHVDDVKELLIGGEDYELIFTIKQKDQIKLERYFNSEKILVSKVGKIISGSGISLFDNNQPTQLPKSFGFDHFS